MIRNLTGDAAGEAVGYTVDNIRDMRRKGLLEGYGERLGLEYLYADQEIFRLAIARLLSKSGFGLRAAFQVVSDHQSQLDAAFDRVASNFAGEDFHLTFSIGDDAGSMSINVSAIACRVIDRIPARARKFGSAPARRFQPYTAGPASNAG